VKVPCASQRLTLLIGCEKVSEEEEEDKIGSCF
jgi:hypothetical protein